MKILVFVLLIQCIICLLICSTGAKTLFFPRLWGGDKNLDRKIKEILLEKTNCGFVYVDADLTVQFENLKNKEGFNVQGEGVYCYEQIYGKDKPCENCIALKAMQTGEKEVARIVVGDDVHFEVTATPVNNRKGASVGVLLKFDNVTAHERTVRKLQQAVETLEEAQKIKTQFLSNMSHEIRTPLNAIIGFSDCLLEEKEEEQKKRYVEIIRKNNTQLLQLVDDIFQQTLLDADMMEFAYADSSLRGLFESLEMRHGTNCKPGVELHFVYQPEEHVACIDEKKVKDVLSHLINNAIKFTEKGEVKVEYLFTPKKLWFGVTDTGVGISKSRQEEIFERFIKIDDFMNGTGLGLSICKSVVEKMGGRIGVKSMKGQGSQFWFIVPIA